MSLVGCEKSDIIEIPDEEWNSMSKEEQEEILNEYANDFLANNVDYGAIEIKES